MVALSLPVLGQTAPPVTFNLPELPPPASAPELTAPGLELKFPHWREPLTKREPLVQFSAQPRTLQLRPELIASAETIPGHCSEPLIEIPLPEHFDDSMVRKMGPHPDDKMAVTPQPICPLRGSFAKEPKHK